VTCLRKLQSEASRIGRHAESEYLRKGRSDRWERLRAEEVRLHDVIAIVGKNPCQCAECRVELEKAG
jgi:hypothetical protein